MSVEFFFAVWWGGFCLCLNEWFNCLVLASPTFSLLGYNRLIISLPKKPSKISDCYVWWMSKKKRRFAVMRWYLSSTSNMCLNKLKTTELISLCFCFIFTISCAVLCCLSWQYNKPIMYNKSRDNPPYPTINTQTGVCYRYTPLIKWGL